MSAEDVTEELRRALLAGRLEPEEISRLLAAGAEVNEVIADDGATPLLVVAANRNAPRGEVAPVLAMLIDAGADLNACDEDDATALHRAIARPDSVRVLLHAGADVSAVDRDGLTPLDRARAELRAYEDEEDEEEDERAKALFGFVAGLRTTEEEALRESIHLLEAGPGRARASRADVLALGPPASGELLEALELGGLGFREVSAGVRLLESEPRDRAELAAAWVRLRAEVRARGWSCFVTSRGLDAVAPDRRDVERELAQLERFDAAAWFEDRAAERLEDEDPDDEGGIADRRRALAELTEVPDVRERAPTFGGAEDARRVRLVLIEGDGSAAPILYRFGGWNDAPRPLEQAGILRSWRARFGAELAFLGRDVLELAVAEPPAELEQVRTAALEIALFSAESESAEEDIDTVRTQTWFFWWD